MSCGLHFCLQKIDLCLIEDFVSSLNNYKFIMLGQMQFYYKYQLSTLFSNPKKILTNLKFILTLRNQNLWQRILLVPAPKVPKTYVQPEIVSFW